MSKQEFLDALKEHLSGFPKEELDERLDFYSEMIDDRIESGLPEEDAVLELGAPKAVAAQILKETPLLRLAKERIKKKRRLATWEIILLAVGSPVWLSLLIAAAAVLLSLYASLWSVLVSLWAAFASLAGGALGGLAGGTVFLFSVGVPVGLAVIGGGLVCAGLSIFLFFGCRAATKGTLIFTKRITLWTKRLFLKKEEA